MKKAYAVPHPPIILPEIERCEEEKIRKTIDAYKRVAREIAELKPETIIISSPHALYYRDAYYLADSDYARGNFGGFGYPELGEEVSIDKELSEEIVREGEGLPIYYSREDADNLDHGCLVPLSFIREVYRDFKIVRLGLSTNLGREHYKVGQAVAKATEKLGRTSVYIASGDLSHVLKDYGPYGYREAGPKFDKKLVDILERGSFDELLKISCYEADEAGQCGLGSFQMMAGYLDGYRVEAEKYSYEGPFGVGYGVFAFTGLEKDESRCFLEKKQEQDPYIELARKSIRAMVSENVEINSPKDLPEEMYKDKAGAFVSIHNKGELRGCIGTIGPTRDNIAEEIIQNAISASTSDFRFPAIRKNELDELDISVDILEEAEPVESLDDLDEKIYGVIVTSGHRRGLLLPNLDGVNSPEEQIFIALRKAGIGEDEEFYLERFKVTRHEYK